MVDLPQNETRERILDTAERLFMARGYSSVRLRDIADEVGMKHASLYYYVPKGKEQLFIAVVKRSMERHEREMNRLIAEAGDNVQDQTYAVVDWIISQPPIDMARMAGSDLPEIDPQSAAELGQLMIDSLANPLKGALNRAQTSGCVTKMNTGAAALSLISLVQSVHHIPTESVPGGRTAFGRELADMLLFGWVSR